MEIPNHIKLPHVKEQRFAATPENLQKYSLRFCGRNVRVKFRKRPFEGKVITVKETTDYPKAIMVIIENNLGERRAILGLRKIVITDELEA